MEPDDDERGREATFRLEMSAGLAPGWRFPLMLAAFVSLVSGVSAGLFLLGWVVPAAMAAAARYHGPLMVCGFFGTVIGLERAVALGRRWAYTGPLCSGLGGLGLIFSAPGAAAAAFVTAGSLVLFATSLFVWVKQRALFTLTLALGAACWSIGNGLWLGGTPLARAVPWWIAFLVLTIAGERLELSRVLPPSRTAKAMFGAIVAAMLAALIASPTQTAVGALLFAAVLLLLACWLLFNDIARHTIRQQGLTRFIAVCLLSAYAWLAIGALVILLSGSLAPATQAYDAALHAVLLGFVFSMVFGHAPIIFPAVLRVSVPYHPMFYVPLIMLHLSLAARLAGDLASTAPLRSAGGLLNALALLLFVAGTIAAVVRGRRAVHA